MRLSTYVEAVRNGVNEAALLADQPTRDVANRLADAVGSSTRLALIQALADAASEISVDLAPASVELRMSGGEPTFVIDQPRDSSEPTMILPPEQEASDGREEPDDQVETGENDEPTARISLRLPVSVKERVDRAADDAGVSTNTWLTRAVLGALSAEHPEGGRSRSDRREGNWGQGNWGQGNWGEGINQLFGTGGPFGPNGVFGEHGVFAGPQGGRGGKGPRPHNRFDRRDGRGGKVQGWVR